MAFDQRPPGPAPMNCPVSQNKPFLLQVALVGQEKLQEKKPRQNPNGESVFLYDNKVTESWQPLDSNRKELVAGGTDSTPHPLLPWERAGDWL